MNGKLPPRLEVPHERAKQLLADALRQWKSEFDEQGVEIAWIGAVGVFVNCLLDEMGDELAADWIEQLVSLYLEGRDTTPIDEVTH